mgnify:CR=1 FL=1
MKKSVLIKSYLFVGLIFSLGLVLSNNLLAKGQASQHFVSDPVIATINSKPLKITEIENKKINDLRQQLFDLVQVELMKESVRKLGEKYPEYAKEPDIKIKDRDAKAFYLMNNLSSRGPYDKLKTRIVQHLEEKAELQFYSALFQQAVKKGLVVSYLEEPNRYIPQADVGTAYLRGSKDAKVMVLEFSDYQCPYCSRVQSTIAKLREEYKDKVVFGYRHNPLFFHEEADESAIAAECARDQGKFEEYHDLLFTKPQNQLIDDLKSYAEQLGIKDLNKFNSCLDNETYRGRLKQDMRAATKAGVEGAPGFVIGIYDRKTNTVKGEILAGAQQIMVFVATIEKYLK